MQPRAGVRHLIRSVLKFSRAATAAFAMAAAAVAIAQSSGGPYAIEKAVIASGGATLAGGSFRLSGTVGQPATTRLSATGFSLNAGFWAPEGSAPDSIFSNGFDP
jgi:hypothetical protein